MRTKSLLSAAAAVAALSFATAAFATHYVANVNISAANEVPTNASPATGTAFVSINTVTNTLTYNITYSGLTAAETAAHIHGFAAAGVNAGVKHALPATAGLKTGTWTYVEADEANILAGLTYINIHTSANPGGEIRGQISPVNSTDTPATSTWALGLMGLGLLVTAGVAVRRQARA